MTVAGALIRPMSAADTAPAAELLRRGDWGERLVFFDWAVRQPTLAPLVAVRAGEIVGTGVGSAHGSVGWVGTIFVAPDRRREGLGEALTRTVIDDLERRGCRTLVLIATDAGRPLYERLGFEVLVPQVFFSAPGLAPKQTDDRIRPFDQSMLTGIVALDRLATGEDRSTLMERVADPESTRVLVGLDGSQRGFVIRASWGGVSLVAPKVDDAIHLLEWRRRQAGLDHPVYAGLPGGDDHRRAPLESAGWTLAGRGTRMIRGAPLGWNPDWIWGTFSGALG